MSAYFAEQRRVYGHLPTLRTSLPTKRPARLSYCWKLSMTALYESDLFWVHDDSPFCKSISIALS